MDYCFIFCTNNFSCVVRRARSNERYPGSKLNPGTLTAPERFHLVLLRSRPDTVHGFPSRKTQISTPLVEGSSTENSPKQTITSAIADCRNRVPLPPRLARKLYDLIIFGIFLQDAYSIILNTFLLVNSYSYLFER